MSRPRKWRKVCCLPDSDQFGPLGIEQDDTMIIMMSVEEYESIRLIDLEGYTQEACAKQMDVARTTVQGIYAEARKKLAESLVNGRVLRIVGGDYKICDGAGRECHGGGCRRHGEVREEE